MTPAKIAYHGTRNGARARTASRMIELNDGSSDLPRLAKLTSRAVQDPGDGGDEGADAEHDDPGHVDAEAERRHRRAASRRGRAAPARAGRDGSARSQRTATTTKAKHEVVVALVAAAPRRARHAPALGERREHEGAGVEDPLDHDPEAERGEGQEQAGQPDRTGSRRARRPARRRAPARSTARIQGMPASTANCENATAPMAANAAVHSETMPGGAHEQAERQDEDRSCVSALVQYGVSLSVHDVGTIASSAEHDDAADRCAASAARATAGTAGPRRRSAAPACCRGVTSITTIRIEERQAGRTGRPSQGYVISYFVEHVSSRCR